MDETFDAFKSVNLDQFKKKKNSLPKKIDKKEIRKTAESAGFISRQPSPATERSMVKSATLFQAEIDIIGNCKLDISESGDFTPSDSDIIRAALHGFKQLPKSERMNLIISYRGRGRR